MDRYAKALTGGGWRLWYYAASSQVKAMLTATSTFMDSMERWMQAARADDFATARSHAENMASAGERLVKHPDFVRCFTQHFPNVEPRDALFYLRQFFVCATEGRARVLKEWLEQNRPIDKLNEPDK